MRRLLVGLACLAVAAVAVLFARDVWHVEKGIRDGDLRAQVGDLAVREWDSDTLLPFGVARRALDAEDDVRYRRVVAEAIELSDQPAETTAEVRRRAPIEVALTRMKRDGDPRRASDAANLLGLMLLTDPVDPNSPLESPAQKAVREFRFAVLMDPANDDAKANLEAMLQNQRSESTSGQADPGGGNQPGKGAAGLGIPGNGF
jgi:hypothetical protein